MTTVADHLERHGQLDAIGGPTTTRLEHGERQAHALPTDTVFVAIYWRPCREWSEIA